MHLVLQGVVKKLCTYYFTKVPFLHLSCRLSEHLLIKLSTEIDDIRKYLPSEFHRKLSSLVNFKNWKASEFRQFVLYLGPFLLHDKLPDRYYDHFIMLHFSMYVLASDEYFAYHVIASECVKKFVEFMPILFSKRSMVYNLHVLIHLASFVAKYGPLDYVKPLYTFLYLSKVLRIGYYQKSRTHAYNVRPVRKCIVIFCRENYFLIISLVCKLN